MKYWIFFSLLLFFVSSFSTRFNLPTSNWFVHNHLNFNNTLMQKKIVQMAENAMQLVSGPSICSTVSGALQKTYPEYYWGVTFIP